MGTPSLFDSVNMRSLVSVETQRCAPVFNKPASVWATCVAWLFLSIIELPCLLEGSLQEFHARRHPTTTLQGGSHFLVPAMRKANASRARRLLLTTRPAVS